ncbi:MAG: hypothetical protein HUJ22_01130 [Gracilimonas sp.]|uniref:hypothetical protein n=1 Tax=Gracilimonas sp. TaxID=1974203 RepID=UPI0019CA8418|nr:hypothetical protein [Gracilimonas sp.]MBD3615144.1 hypothetical protein [Gracilimonas sp.]
MILKKIFSPLTTFTLLIIIMAGCDTTSTDTKSSEGNVKLQFKTATGTSGTAAKALASGNSLMSQHDSLIVEGSNGTLTINDIRFIVEKFKLEPADVENDTVEIEYEEFEAEPFFIDLPLTDDTLNLGNNQIKAGFYEEFEFEVKDLDFEFDEEEEDHQALADSIRSEFPEWPEEASMIIIGSFTPTGGESQAFMVFAKAEIEVELEFEPPLEVTEDMEHVVSVNIDPTQWVLQEDGSVINLTDYNWGEREELLEFSAKFKEGLLEVEVDEEDFDDEDED